VKKRPRGPGSKQSPTPQELGAKFERVYNQCQELWHLELLLDPPELQQLMNVHLQLCKLEELARLNEVSL